jgi:hypothetical protein
MPGQLCTYYIENPLMVISINSGSWGGVMVIRVVIYFGELAKVKLKSGAMGKGVDGGRDKGTAGVCGSHVCLSVFLLSWRVLVLVIAGSWGCTQLVQ